MSQEEVDLLFDFFDQDNTNVLEAHEMEAMYNKLVEHPESIRLNGGRGWAAKSYWRSSRAEEAADRMSFDSH